MLTQLNRVKNEMVVCPEMVVYYSESGGFRIHLLCSKHLLTKLVR